MTTQIENKTAPQTEHNIKLTSAEIANIWSNYMSDSAAICTLGSFLSHVEDKEIKSSLEFAERVSQAHIQKIEAFFREEQHPIPDGFSAKTI
jgi:hypothetical protein